MGRKKKKAPKTNVCTCSPTFYNESWELADDVLHDMLHALFWRTFWSRAQSNCLIRMSSGCDFLQDKLEWHRDMRKIKGGKKKKEKTSDSLRIPFIPWFGKFKHITLCNEHKEWSTLFQPLALQRSKSCGKGQKRSWCVWRDVYTTWSSYFCCNNSLSGERSKK